VAAEAMALSKAEQFKKDIIYAAHVLRYANSYDYSHYVPKGPNGLTGIDELDRASYGDLDPAGVFGHGFGYAQTSEVEGDAVLHDLIITDNEVDDEHAEHLLELMENAAQGFKDMVQACRDDFQAIVDEAKAESADKKAELDEVILNAGALALE
jgi:hypothetical protein